MNIQQNIDEIRAAQSQTRSEGQQQHDAKWQALADAVLRQVTDQARKDDDQLLASLVTDLEVSDDYLASFFEKARDACQHVEEHRRRDADAAELQKCRKRLKDLEAEYKEKLAEAKRACIMADTAATKSGMAEGRLQRIMRSHKWYFAQGDPLRLRIKACAKPGPLQATASLGK